MARTGWVLHHVRFRLFHAQCQRREQIRSKVNRQDLPDGKSQRDGRKGGRHHERKDLGHIARKNIGDEFANVVKYRPAFFDRRNDRAKVIGRQNDVGGLLGNIRANDAH